MNPSRPLPVGWEPTLTCKQNLHREYGKEVDLGLTLKKFRAYHSEGQTSRDWDQRFTTWVIGDVTRIRERERGGTNDMGVPLNQQPATTTPLTPDDEGYVSLDELAETARQQALAAQQEEA